MSGVEIEISQKNKELLDEFSTALTVDRSLSNNTLSAYISDLKKLIVFCENQDLTTLDKHLVLAFINNLKNAGLSSRSIASQASQQVQGGGQAALGLEEPEANTR
mgnify:CR=1 FL=1